MKRHVPIATLLLSAACAAPAVASEMIVFNDGSGLSAKATFTMLSATTLEVRLQNTSSGVPPSFSNSDQILTGVSWDFGAPGANPDDPTIIGGSVVIGPTSMSVNFSEGSFGAGADISGEYGYGNGGTTGFFPNFFSTNQAGTNPFGGANLDGPVNISGPQGGVIPDPPQVDLGGLGAVQDEIVATLALSDPVDDLDFLDNLVTVEFGSDATFITSPEPASMFVLGAGALVKLRRYFMLTAPAA